MQCLVASCPRMHLPTPANATLHTTAQRSENSDRLGQRHVTLDGPTVQNPAEKHLPTPANEMQDRTALRIGLADRLGRADLYHRRLSPSRRFRSNGQRRVHVASLARPQESF
jgi:hypothetical protein